MGLFNLKLVLLWLLLLAAAPLIAAEVAPPPAAVAAEELQATITGQIMINDKTPMTGGVILLYDSTLGPPPSLGRYWRVPDHITALEKDGSFTLTVPEGTYFFQAAHKNPAGDIGPATEKEYLYFHGDADGNALPLVVGKGANIKLGKLKAFLWSPDMVKRDKGITAVEGVVVDTDNKPVERVVVLAYYNAEGNGRPVFISDRTDKRGRFLLRVNDGGTYYLKVRGVVGGGRPTSGEYLNTTKEFAPQMVTLARAQRLQGVTLKAMQFSRPNEEIEPLERREWRKLEQ